MSTMYESMKPDVTQMQGLIDDYREAGKAVPQSLMDSFNDAIEVGAAAGDTSATWQNYANQIINNFLPTIHEVYQSAQRGCCMVCSINMDMDTT